MFEVVVFVGALLLLLLLFAAVYWAEPESDKFVSVLSLTMKGPLTGGPLFLSNNDDRLEQLTNPAGRTLLKMNWSILQNVGM